MRIKSIEFDVQRELTGRSLQWGSSLRRMMSSLHTSQVSISLTPHLKSIYQTKHMTSPPSPVATRSQITRADIQPARKAVHVYILLHFVANIQTK